MIAIEISSFGSPEVLRAVERPVPEVQPDEVLIAVEAAGVSRADVMQRQGKYPPPTGACDIPGLDVAGSIAAVGSRVTQWKAGDRVCALVTGGGYAEFCTAPAPQVLPIPEGWSAAEAVTLPENLFTVYDNLVTRAQLAAGDVVLIHGGTSGIGSMATMTARAVGATPIATAGSDEKCAACLAIGAAAAFNYRTEDFVEAARRFAGGCGVNVVLDLVGAAYLERNIEALAPDGRVVILATQGGSNAAFSIPKLMAKRGSIIATSLRARTVAEKGIIARLLRERIWPLLPAWRTIRPLIDATFPLRDARLAHERMESGAHVGKIVLTIGHEHV